MPVIGGAWFETKYYIVTCVAVVWEINFNKNKKEPLYSE